MELFFEIIQFIFFSGLIVLISKYILVKTLRNLAENLNLKPKTVGDIAGIATSIPELLTISISSFNGLISASIYNVLSSNVINLIQYYTSILLNKNRKAFKNKAIKVDVVLVCLTIIIPILFLVFKSELKIEMVPILILLYFGFKKINDNVHKLYLKMEDAEIEEERKKDDRWEIGNKRKVGKNVFILILSGILLFFIGNLLGNNLENLCNKFDIPEVVIGIILGFITSLPELITFFESQKHHKNSKSDMLGVVEATNNLLMSNILNLFIIQSIGVIIFSIFYG
ncbi:MAG: hypothetical protein HFJ55_02100 [Clostridia bacterium]|nr:hypothetical protein [Clostridia bacterium]